MELNKRNLMIGAAAAAILVAIVGVVAGRTVFAPKHSHAGETMEEHDAELAAAGGESAEKGDADSDEKGEAEGAEGAIKMEAEALATAGITLQTLAPSSFASEVNAQASVKAAPDGEAVLTARAAGAVTQIRKRLGDPVGRGETVAMVASADAATISASLLSAKASLDLAQSTYDREKRLFDAKITARQELEAAQAELGEAQAEFRRADATAKAARVSADGASVSLASPIGGRVTFVSDMAKLGAYVSPEDVLFRVADPSRIQIEAAVPVGDARRIAPGDLAEIVVASGDPVPAVVRSVTPGLDAESRSATVVLALSGGPAGLQPGQFVRARIKPRSSAPVEGRFVLPEEAVQTVEGRDVVFVREGDNFTAVQVQTGARGSGQIEILSGLSEGQVVAAKNAFLLKAEVGKGDVEE